ncbi:MAG: DUF2065 domain-containing protein [Ruminococcus sp.]|nr:DUF2065 domain-containing protein [Ruminococcus sp.]
MMKNHSFTQFRPSALRIIGLLMMTAGLAIIFSFNLRSSFLTEKKEKPQAPSEESITEESNADESIISDYEENTETARKVSAKGMPYILIGGILIMGGIPMFFVPYDDKGLYLRSKKERKKKEDEEPAETDPEFDYPDDDYDFIVRKETYELLHKQQLENIRNKNSKQN